MVSKWNDVVDPEDEVWHLGDFARNLKIASEVLPNLHGRKHLLRGNNDPPELDQLQEWISVRDYAELKAGRHSFVLGHYAFRTWNGQHRKAINLHGHSHGRLKPMPRQIDVGVDCWEFRPASLIAILTRAGVVRKLGS